MPRIKGPVALTIALAIVVSACGTTSTSPAPSAPAGGTAAPSGAAPTQGSTDPVELTFMLWAYEGTIKEDYDTFISEFLAKEPRVSNINVEFHPFARYHDVLNVKIAGGTPPDVAHIAFNLAPAYIDAGHFLNLKPILAGLPDYDYDDLRPSSLLPWTSDGQVYGVPFTNSTNVMYYNADVFAAAGLPTPDEMVASGTWNWENVKAAAKQIKDRGAADYGMVFGNQIFTNGWRILEDIWAPYGAGPWPVTDKSTCTFNSPETVTATQLVWDMIYTDKSHPEPGVDVDFFAGNTGMGLYRPSQAGKLKDVSYQWGIAPQPSGPLGYVPSDATNGVTVFKASPNAELAAEFVAYTTAKDQARRMGRNFPSPRLSMQDADVLAEVNPILSKEDIQTTIVDALAAENASWGYSHPNWGPVFGNAQRVFDGRIWTPDADVKAALDQVCADIGQLLGN